MQQQSKNIYEFLFKLNDKECISLPLTPDITFMFSGKFLSHCQNGNTSIEKDNNEFVNLSSYGNHTLFTHIRESFARNIQSEFKII